MAAYDQTRARVETYFDKTATRTWERLTSDAPVSKVRATVRAGRDRMRALMLSRLPADLHGARVLDAGCGAGQMSLELARRGAQVVGCDIAPNLIDIARQRTPSDLMPRITYVAGDMLDPAHGRFDHVVAMDSLIYYDGADIGRALAVLEARTSGAIVFTVPPRTRLLMAMFYAGKLFPQSDRSPVMVPHDHLRLSREIAAQGVRRRLRPVEQVTSGFYIAQALELVP